jgi:6-phosphogluconolactonase
MKPEIRVFQTMEQLSRNAAELFVDQAARAVAERERFLVALNGGGTPKLLFELLGTQYRDNVDWSKTHIFWGDERSVPSDDAESSYGQARSLFLRHVAIPEANVHPINGELEPDEAAEDYARVLHQFAASPLEWPRFDLIYLGMGEDGHTASLFPGSPIEDTDPVIPVTGHYQNRPAQRVTLTPLVINSARMVVFMATGDKKAVTLAEVLGDRFNPELYPAQRIDPKDGKLIWLVDEDAAGKLPHRLISRFCEG